MVAATHSDIPTLVFDEVDVGIGGSTADIVGQLLKQLGDRGQVISVTHQPQVAAHAHHHYRASKIIETDSAESLMVQLDQQRRVEELARMLGGSRVTEQTLSHASELLSLASGWVSGKLIYSQKIPELVGIFLFRGHLRLRRLPALQEHHPLLPQLP